MILQKSLLICWFAAQETFLIIINVKNGSEMRNIFVETVIFGQDFLNKMFLRTAFV